MTDAPWAIVPLARNQIDAAVNVHLRAFPNFFLSFLGTHFLKEFYRSFLEDDSGIGLMAVSTDGHLLGTVVGTTHPTNYFRRLFKRRWWAFAFASFGAVCRRPATIPRLFRAIYYRGATPHAGSNRALLSSIAVATEMQGHGLGQALIAAFIEVLRQRGGVPGCYLMTDAIGNDAVNAFYLRCGWRADGSYITPEGRRMNYYLWDLDS
jgi:GNAT superfamily N-acetyltransferase